MNLYISFVLLIFLLTHSYTEANDQILSCSYQREIQTDFSREINAKIIVENQKIKSLSIESYLVAPRGLSGFSCDYSTKAEEENNTWVIDGVKTYIGFASSDVKTSRFIVEKILNGYRITPENIPSVYCSNNGIWAKSIVINKKRKTCIVQSEKLSLFNLWLHP